jgi:uncharacterized coiled-coil protein SlyX
MSDLDKRLEELEIRHAFQEERVTQLDEVVREQADKIVDLQRDLASLKSQVQEGGTEEASSLEDEVPPHY